MPNSLNPNLLEDWPAHYFEIEDIFQREAALQKRLQASADPADSRRLELLHFRYGTGKRERPDGFMKAWLTLKVMTTNAGSFRNERQRGEFYSCLEAFGIQEDNAPDEILLEEWRDFALRMITICRNDRTYRTTGFGLVPVSEEYTDRKIADDIKKIFHDLPSAYGCLNLISPLTTVVEQVYCQTIEHGRDYLKHAGR